MQKKISALFFVIILLVVPFCLYCEMKMGQQIEALLKQGEKVRHEGLEMIFVIGYFTYSLPFLVWLGFLYTKNQKTKWQSQLTAIFIFAVVPAIFIYYLFARITFK
ncbi:MAG: hypothetical protein IPH89_11545 [Bacteroidetes bacterium]|nr:hypothetical protein [Bacteroidota bacterium]